MHLECSIAVSMNCSIREYQFIFMELSSIVWNIRHLICQYYTGITLQPIMLFIMLAYLMQAFIDIDSKCLIQEHFVRLELPTQNGDLVNF